MYNYIKYSGFGDWAACGLPLGTRIYEKTAKDGSFGLLAGLVCCRDLAGVGESGTGKGQMLKDCQKPAKSI